VSKTFAVIVLVGGPAGYVCAIRAAQLGLNTAVVEKDKLGGVCVNIGCIPTKALLHSALVANTIAHDAKGLGISVDGVSTDYGVAMKRSRRVSEQNSKGVGFLMKKNKITVIGGAGTLQPGQKVAVGDEVYSATKGVVIATGSHVKGIPPAGLTLDGKVIISSDDALFLEHAPDSIAVVGAGAVGCEFADIFNAFGSKVTLIEALPRILPLEDADASEVIAKSFKKRKIKTIAGAMVKNTTVTDGSATLEVEADGKTEPIVVDVVLVAAGRGVNTDNIGLEAIGAKLDDRGFIEVNRDTLETVASGYYAIGDVAGPPMLAHKGSREGVVVAERLAGQQPHPIRYDNIPSVTYCHPEVASIGLTEEDCREQGLDYQVGSFPFSANGRARASNATDGFVKILRETQFGEILGAHIVGANASEMIHELAVARENEFTVEEVDLAVHAHPTLSEAIAEAALDSLGRVMHT